MRTIAALLVLMMCLLGGGYWYYDQGTYTIPEKIEITAWAKENIHQQLAQIKKPATASDVKKAYDYLNTHLMHKDIVYFSIRNRKVAVLVPGKHLKKITYFKVMNYVITKLAQRKHLKDNDFLVALRDRTEDIILPPELAHVPIFVFSKNRADDQHVTRLLIVDPFTLKSWGEIYKTLKKGAKLYPWEKKENKLFWRGKTTDSVDITEIRMNSPRVALVKLTKQFPNRYDARLTKILSSDPMQIAQIILACGEPVPFASTYDHLSFKYQITLDGQTATFPGYLWRMGSGCANIKQDSTEVQWFYDLFKPYVHYLPVARDLSNLDTIMVNACSHDIEMKEMTTRAWQVVEEELTPNKVSGYFVELLNAYAAKSHR